VSGPYPCTRCCPGSPPRGRAVRRPVGRGRTVGFSSRFLPDLIANRQTDQHFDLSHDIAPTSSTRTHGQEVLRRHLRTERDGPYDMRMLERMQSFPAVRIPDLAMCGMPNEFEQVSLTMYCFGLTGTLLTQRNPHCPSRRETCLARSCCSKQPLCVLQ
jgi:hypothetical protein